MCMKTLHGGFYTPLICMRVHLSLCVCICVLHDDDAHMHAMCMRLGFYTVVVGWVVF